MLEAQLRQIIDILVARQGSPTVAPVVAEAAAAIAGSEMIPWPTVQLVQQAMAQYPFVLQQTPAQNTAQTPTSTETPISQAQRTTQE